VTQSSSAFHEERRDGGGGERERERDAAMSVRIRTLAAELRIRRIDACLLRIKLAETIRGTQPRFFSSPSPASAGISIYIEICYCHLVFSRQFIYLLSRGRASGCPRRRGRRLSVIIYRMHRHVNGYRYHGSFYQGYIMSPPPPPPAVNG